MKAAFGAEAIGLHPARRRMWARVGLDKEVYRKWRPWLAELLGPSPTHGYQRRFLHPKVDYTHANGPGTRGVWFWWTLESGCFYEARYPVTWDRQEHRFMTVNRDGDVVDISEEEIKARWEEEEVRARWANKGLESMF